MVDTHALRRTSPKGQNFVGTCMKCGQENIPVQKMHEPCVNPANLTQDDTLMLAIREENDRG